MGTFSKNGLELLDGTGWLNLLAINMYIIPTSKGKMLRFNVSKNPCVRPVWD